MLFHLIAIVLAAIPAPAGGMNRRNWKDPTVQAEFDEWGRRLGMDPDVLEDAVFSFAQGYMQARDLWLAPVEPYLDVTGTDQPWRMFVAPHRHPARFRVQAMVATSGGAAAASGAWETLFEERSAEAAWRSSFFEEERIRSILFRYSWPEYSTESRRFCQWLADRAFEERPELAKVRCSYEKRPSPSPDDVRDGVEHESTTVQAKVISRKGAVRRK